MTICEYLLGRVEGTRSSEKEGVNPPPSLMFQLTPKLPGPLSTRSKSPLTNYSIDHSEVLV